VASLVLGIVSIPMFFFFVPAIVAVVLGAVARRRIKADPASTGTGMANAGLALGIVSLVGAAAFVIAAISTGPSNDTVRYSSLRPGDCYEEPGPTAGKVTLESCAGDHDREAFAVVDHPAPQEAAYPGREALQSYADRECVSRFANYVGMPLDRSDLRVVFILPSSEAWTDLGFRRIVCGVRSGDGEPLSGPARSSVS
jgi:hypothetical protein